MGIMVNIRVLLGYFELICTRICLVVGHTWALPPTHYEKRPLSDPGLPSGAEEIEIPDPDKCESSEILLAINWISFCI